MVVGLLGLPLPDPVCALSGSRGVHMSVVTALVTA
jgi:hypothetical protein